jgi:hypothetical protein
MAEMFFGCVDGYDHNEGVIRGWVVNRDRSSLGNDITVIASRSGKQLASCQPNLCRNDISDKPGHKTGYSLLCGSQISANDMAVGLVNVTAVDNIGQQHELPIWKQIRDRAFLHLLKEQIRHLGLRDILELLSTFPDNSNLDRAFVESIQRCATTAANLANPLQINHPEQLQRRDFGDVALASLDFKIGTTSSDGSTILGRNGYLFLTEGSNAVLSRYQESSVRHESRATAWINLFGRRAAAVDREGIQYIQTVVPEKTSVLPQHFPYVLGTPTGCLRAVEQQMVEGIGPSGRYVSAYAALCSEDSKLPTYAKTDSHPSAYGAYLMSMQMLRSLGLSSAIEVSEWVMRPYSGDLSNRFFGVPIYEEMAIPKAIGLDEDANRPELLRHHKPKELRNTGTNRVWKRENAPFPLKVVAFGNSCFGLGSGASQLSWWFSRLFSEFHFVWTGEFDLTYVQAERPDIVICQTVERFLFVNPPKN